MRAMMCLGKSSPLFVASSDLEMHQSWVTSELTPIKRKIGLRKSIFAKYDVPCHV